MSECLSYLDFLKFVGDWCVKLQCYAEDYCEGVYLLKPRYKVKI